MSGPILEALQVATLVGSGIVGGVFFAFSTFVMRALARVPSAEGIRAMQAINVTVLSPWFLGAFIGTAVTGAGLALAALLARSGIDAALPAAGGLLYVVGTFGVTIAFNVPRNEALAELDPDDAASATRWADYLQTWTVWNHVRTVAAIAAVGLLLVAR